MKITIGQLRQLIREEVQKMSTKTLVKEDISKGDLVFFHEYENERGMTVSKGVTIGKVSRIIGSRNVEVTAVSPSNVKGDTLKIQKASATPFPKKGQKVRIKAEFNSGSGSGSQSFEDIDGVVVSADPNNAQLVIKNEDGKNVKLHLSQILKMK